MKIHAIILLSFLFAFDAAASGRCASRVHMAALDWAKEIIESDLESQRQIGSGPILIDIKAPVLLDKSKNSPQVFERYTIDWSFKFNNKNWEYTGFYFYDQDCHRMKLAESLAGKEVEKRKLKESSENKNSK